MTEAERQAAWDEERARVMKARYDAKRAAEIEGRPYMELEPLPTKAPAWFLNPDGRVVRKTYDSPGGKRLRDRVRASFTQLPPGQGPHDFYPSNEEEVHEPSPEQVFAREGGDDG